MTTAAIALLQLRLTQLGYDGAVATADDCRTAILSLLASEAVAGRVEVNGKQKLMRFRELFEHVYGVKWETREAKARKKEKVA